MTYEELKNEAKKLGYNLIKQPTYIKMLPCPCGAPRTRIRHYSTVLRKWYYCTKCGFHGNRDAKTITQAKINWNTAVKELQNERY